MRTLIGDFIAEFMDRYRLEHGLPALWQAPLVRLGDAEHPRLEELSRIAVPDHFLPCDFLPEAATIVSYFIPFRKDVGASNRDGETASDLWGLAYRATNAMAEVLNRALARRLNELGHQAAVPENIDYSREKLTSRWSQRHIAWLCGQGTFGVNNMLIGEQGCCGRYFSIVADFPADHDEIAAREYCAYKRDGSCLACVKRCVNGALRANGFDRHLCFAACNANAPRLQGAHVCGKCVAALPCSFRKP